MAGAYVAEATLVSEAFWTTLLGRTSVPGGRLFATGQSARHRISASQRMTLARPRPALHDVQEESAPVLALRGSLIHAGLGVFDQLAVLMA